MTARSLDGAEVAAAITSRTAERAARFREQAGRPAGLVVVLAGDDAASTVYVRKKEEGARAAGLAGTTLRLPPSAAHEEVLAAVRGLNDDAAVDGILVQLPLPRQVRSDEILAAVHPDKDVDGFHPLNVGRLQLGLPSCRPCTPAGVMEALAFHQVPLAGRHAVVVGRSNIVGKPMAALLLAKDATVTICHSRTRDLDATCRQADVLVVAVGRPGMVGRAAVREGATVVDVGMNRLEHPRDDDTARRMLGEGSTRWNRYVERGDALVGDVDWLAVREVAGLLTPVPGGVGPLTIAMLLSNTVDAAERRAGLNPG
jgi:methylenetetrahydrofolate dehydrogenase (NADP+)/methenyltetrahydrofolate cyclohydrolase